MNLKIEAISLSILLKIDIKLIFFSLHFFYFSLNKLYCKYFKYILLLTIFLDIL